MRTNLERFGFLGLLSQNLQGLISEPLGLYKVQKCFLGGFVDKSARPPIFHKRKGTFFIFLFQIYLII
ncbi:hypothetical protein IX84_05450 [Phaeodactylibacter xiamenensis]|uniref:Uncharacterized protein n=1 Tax=Phaeodactylibacter xiamenensis TaxID=1524460 RepID=A0A098SAN8_9BACT|nr:hypothetical protein IX84_05450 [Phaeodactylibacter xiamenensis]